MLATSALLIGNEVLLLSLLHRVACFYDFEDGAFRAKGANTKAAEAAAQPSFSPEDEEDFNRICEMFGNRYTNGPKD